MVKINYIILFILCSFSIVLVIYPDIDLYVSNIFFDPDTSSWKERTKIMVFFRKLFPSIIIFSLLCIIIIGVLGFIFKKVFLNISLVKVYYLLTSLLIGPGLVVESFLKTFSGRARPKEIIEFGGEATFSSALVFSDQCLRNCSFVSGHAAIAFWLTAYAFIFSEPCRKYIFLIGIIFGVSMGLFRIMEGAHFVSDVVFSALIVISINLIIYYLFINSFSLRREVKW